MMPLISVIVPIYQIDRYLGICIESICNQTYTNLEIILVDDGSSDRCPEICDLYASKDKRISVIHKNNEGLVAARKAGILSSHGDYIGYVDGDDWIDKDFYQSLYSFISKSKSDIAIAGFRKDLFNKSTGIQNNIEPNVYEGCELEEFYSKMISYGNFFEHGITTYVWNKLFKRDIVFPAQLAVDDRIKVGEDAAVVYPAMLNSKRICVTDNCSYHYRQREDSMLKIPGDIKRDAYRLKLLYDHLMRMTEKYGNKYGLKDQIDDFVLATYITSSGGRLETKDSILADFPINENIDGKKLILYGAGTFGQQFKNRLYKENMCELIGWIDEDYWEYRRCCMDVDPIDMVKETTYDYVLILSLNPHFVKEATRKLINNGVPTCKIISLNPHAEMRKRALDEYLEIGNKEQ